MQMTTPQYYLSAPSPQIRSLRFAIVNLFMDSTEKALSSVGEELVNIMQMHVPSNLDRNGNKIFFPLHLLFLAPRVLCHFVYLFVFLFVLSLNILKSFVFGS
jgi:hypothetical protein